MRGSSEMRSSRDQVRQIARWLGVFVAPGQVTELRAIGAPGGVVSRCFDHDHLDRMARLAVQLETTGTRGIYFTPNPLRPEMAGAGQSAADADVIARHWLLVDVDPVRPADTSATDAEREAAWVVLDRCRGTLAAIGLANPVIGDSGNGWHICQPIRMPNDDEARTRVRKILQLLHRRCSDEYARVDTSTFNAARIFKLYGTLARKGTASADRPHRYSRLIEIPQS